MDKENEINYIANELGVNYGNELIDSTAIWYLLYTQRMLEKEDRQSLKGFTIKCVKYSLLSLFISGFINRKLTYLKIRNREFINMRFFFRIPIRLAIFFLMFNGITIYLLNDLDQKYSKLYNKYVPRYKIMKNICDPLVMNPKMLNENDMSEEDREYMFTIYQKLKDQLLMEKQMRENKF